MNRNGTKRYPAVKTMPMSISDFAYFSQKIHEELLRKCRIAGDRNGNDNSVVIEDF